MLINLISDCSLSSQLLIKAFTVFYRSQPISTDLNRPCSSSAFPTGDISMRRSAYSASALESRRHLAAEWIQRHWRGSRCRVDLPRLRQFQTANLNAGQHLSVQNLNTIGFWSTSPHLPTSSPVLKFSEETHCLHKDGTKQDVDTDFCERGNRPLCKALKIIEAAIYRKPIYPIFVGADDCVASLSQIDLIMKDIIATLEKGENYRFCSASSTVLRPSPSAVSSVKGAYVKFRYFSNLGPPPLEMVLTEPVGRCTVSPLLVHQAPKTVCGVRAIEVPVLPRVAPRTVCGVKMICQSPGAVDDLEARLQKLMNLPYSK